MNDWHKAILFLVALVAATPTASPTPTELPCWLKVPHGQCADYCSDCPTPIGAARFTPIPDIDATAVATPTATPTPAVFVSEQCFTVGHCFNGAVLIGGPDLGPQYPLPPNVETQVAVCNAFYDNADAFDINQFPLASWGMEVQGNLTLNNTTAAPVQITRRLLMQGGYNDTSLPLTLEAGRHEIPFQGFTVLLAQQTGFFELFVTAPAGITCDGVTLITHENSEFAP